LATRVLRAARPGGGELSVLLVDDAAIAELNSAYRGRPQPTDVLSFSQLEGPTPPAGGAGLLGDVVISVETARRQARERRRPLEEEMATLLIHGVLHLLGHDHERGSAEARRMFAREREVAAAIGLPALALGDRPAAERGGAGRGERR
jgi:rRNA maturation RNase YbeY